MIIQAVLAALGQLGDRRFIWVLAKSVAITIVGLVLMALGLQWLLPETITLPWFGEVAWLGWVLDRAVVWAMLAASTFLMVPVAAIVIGFFLEEVAMAVERLHYPDKLPSQPIGFWAGAAEGMRFLLILIGVNLIALIFYLLFAPFAPIIFIVVNGILLGREYGQLVAMRHLGKAGAAAFRKRNRLTIWVAGMLMAVPLTIPVINLLVPVVGVATYTHLFHRLGAAQSK